MVHDADAEQPDKAASKQASGHERDRSPGGDRVGWRYRDPLSSRCHGQILVINPLCRSFWPMWLISVDAVRFRFVIF